MFDQRGNEAGVKAPLRIFVVPRPEYQTEGGNPESVGGTTSSLVSENCKAHSEGYKK